MKSDKMVGNDKSIDFGIDTKKSSVIEEAIKALHKEKPITVAKLIARANCN